MKKEISLKLEVTDEDNKILGKIEAFSLESLQEQMHKIEKVVEDNCYTCDTCGEAYPLKDLGELTEDDHICAECEKAELEPTQQDLD